MTHTDIKARKASRQGTSDSKQTFARALPHCVCVASLAAAAVLASDHVDGAVTALHVLAAACLFVIAMWGPEAGDATPRWLYGVLGVMFILPIAPPVNRSGWLVLSWLAGLAVLVDGRRVAEDIRPDSAIGTGLRWFFDAAAWALVLSLFAMLRCSDVGASIVTG